MNSLTCQILLLLQLDFRSVGKNISGNLLESLHFLESLHLLLQFS